MKEFKEDKLELEQRIRELLGEFSDKYKVSITDIELTPFINYGDGSERYHVSVKVDV